VDRGKASLGHLLARAAELGGKILELRKPVTHRQNGRPPTIVFCFLSMTIDLKEELAPP
jgi:hypothetical protein